MADYFDCSCGARLAIVDGPDIPIICPQCQTLFLPSPAKTYRPLSQSIVARAGAWGCLLPGGFFLLMLGLRGLLTKFETPAALEAGGGVVFSALFLWILKQNCGESRKFIRMCVCLGVVFAGASGYIWTCLQKQAELNRRFASVLQDAQMPGRTVDLKQSDLLIPKYLPIVLTERGALHAAEIPRVSGELYQSLPVELRPADPAEVRTLVMIDWWYEQTGVYASVDVYRDRGPRIYRGGCTVKVIDRDQHKVVCSRAFSVDSNAPEIRPGDAMNTWYGPQPVEADIVEYIQSLRFQK
jgi:hypothetical protein